MLAKCVFRTATYLNRSATNSSSRLLYKSSSTHLPRCVGCLEKSFSSLNAFAGSTRTIQAASTAHPNIAFRCYSSNIVPAAVDIESGSGGGRQSSETTYSSEDITIKGRDCPHPFLQFSDYAWPKEVQNILRREGFTSPTPIQTQGFPVALEGRDMVGIAQTGSGKTLSFVMPAVVRILEQQNSQSNNPVALVLAPTRELAQQIHSVAAEFPSLRSVCLYGGSNKGGQIRDIVRNKPKFIVATPGRLNDLIESGNIFMEDIRYLVLDEADRMLDMGFEPQIRSIITKTPDNRQTLMWSATWPVEVQSLAEDFLNNYIQINVGSPTLHANHNITQHVHIVDEYEKNELFANLLNTSIRNSAGETSRTLVFTETKRKVDNLVRSLMRNYRVEGIHGDKSQRAREMILNGFKNGRYDILIATDVAARGLDVDDIKYVINFDYPNTSEDYVHRIGRTGRKNLKGVSHTFFTREDMAQAADLIKVMKEAKQDIPSQLDQFADLAITTKAKKRSEKYAQKKQFGQATGPYGFQRQQRRGDNFFSRDRPQRGSYGNSRDDDGNYQNRNSGYNRDDY